MRNTSSNSRNILTLLCFMLISQGLRAQEPVKPQITNQAYNVTSFGAVGDGKFINTLAMQAALDTVAKAGGTLIVPKGIFLCGPITVKSKTNLLLQKGAVLKLIDDISNFPSANERYLNFISIKKANDIKISGEGTIDGQGQLWWDKFTAKEITFRRPQLLYIENCERLEIAGITTLNPPNTHISLKGCKEVYIHHITISAPEKSRNTDGINISAKNVLIDQCKIATGDDNIAINFGNKNQLAGGYEVENMVIRNCDFGYGHGLSIGSFTSGGLKNLMVSNCKFDGTTSAIRIKTARERGGTVENVIYQDLEIKNVKWPIFISQYYPKEPKTILDEVMQPFALFTPVYKNIQIKNVNITNAELAMKIWGLPESPMEDIKLINVNINAKKGIELYHVKNIDFENCKISVANGEKIKTYQTQYTGLK